MSDTWNIYPYSSDVFQFKCVCSNDSRTFFIGDDDGYSIFMMACDYETEDDPKLSEEELEMFVDFFKDKPEIIRKLMEVCI